MVGRMGNYFSILYDDWTLVPETNKEDAWDYIKEHYNIPNSLKNHGIASFWHAWKNHKTRTRRYIDEKLKEVTYEDLKHNPKRGIERRQWKEFLRRYVKGKKKWNALTKKAQETKANLKEFHTCGRTSFARKKIELGPLSPVEFYTKTHMKNGDSMNEYSSNVVEQTRVLVLQKTSQGIENTFALEEEVLREVRGPEHGGRVRGEGNAEIESQRGEIERLKAAMKEKDDMFISMQAIMQEKSDELSTLKQQVQLLLRMQGL